MRMPRRDSMFSAFRLGPAVSGRGLCDINKVLFRVTKSCYRKLGNPCAAKNIPVTWLFRLTIIGIFSPYQDFPMF